MNNLVIVFAVFLIIAAIIVIFLIVDYYRVPFEFPYFYIDIDISQKREPSYDDAIDSYIIENGTNFIDDEVKRIDSWYKAQKNNYAGNKHRLEQLEEVYKRGINEPIIMNLNRTQKRYVQHNYIRSSYNSEICVRSYYFSINKLKKIVEELEDINFECKRSDYKSSEQRKLMTQSLKNKIMERDNYTCQQCGKFMPDKVGLHIDHIIPISKGGKSVESNLQVLCSICNGKKSNRY